MRKYGNDELDRRLWYAATRNARHHSMLSRCQSKRWPPVICGRLVVALAEPPRNEETSPSAFGRTSGCVGLRPDHRWSHLEMSDLAVQGLLGWEA